MNSLADSHFSIDGKLYNRKRGLYIIQEDDSEDDSEDEYVIISSNEGLNETTSMFGEVIAQAKYFVLSSYFAQN
jgi:hypothetical protein